MARSRGDASSRDAASPSPPPRGLADGAAFAGWRRACGASSRLGETPASFGGTPSPADAGSVEPRDRAKTLKERALSDTGVQTMLDVFAAEIKDVEEM